MAGYDGGEKMEEKNNTKSKLIRAGIRLFRSMAMQELPPG